MRIYPFILLIIVFIIPVQLSGQRFQSINNEFPFAKTSEIYQDDFGFLWFGTIDGLVKYDGYSIKEYRKNPGASNSLPGEQVSSVLQISDSLLLVGFLNHGLAEFNRNTGIPKKVQLGIDGKLHVSCLLKVRSGIIWIGSNQGIFKMEGKKITQHFSSTSDSNSLSNNNVLVLKEDKNQKLWVGTSGGIHLYPNDKDGFEGPKTNPGFPNGEVLSIEENSKGEMFVSFRHGAYKIYKWDSISQSFNPVDRFKRDGEFSFIFNTEDEIWASSHGRGVYHFAETKETFFGEEDAKWHGLSAMFTYSIYQDKFHNIWIESDEVSKLPGSHKKFNSIGSDNFQVISVFADEDYIWYCSNEPYRWSRDKKESSAYLSTVDFTELINPGRARKHKRIYQYKEWGENIVFTSIRNVYIWDKGKNKLLEIPTVLEGAFREFIIDEDDRVWIPGDDGNPAIVDLASGEIERPANLSVMKSACAVVQAPDGTQWWGTHNHGLFSYDHHTGSVKKYIPDQNNSETSISSYSINDILVHSDGKVWVGTTFGLNQIDPQSGQIQHFLFEDYITNTNINSILEDDSGILWIGTENGLLKFDPIDQKVRHFTTANGLINTNYTHRACYKDGKGCLYFGGNNGVDYFFPEHIGVNKIPPELYIGELRVNGKAYNDSVAGELLNTIPLKHNENFIEVELVGLHFVAPEAQEYAYRLPNQSEDWIPLNNNRVITLARLSPGDYILEAKSANPDGYWSNPKQLLNIIIAPPFWQTWWFIGFLTIMAAFMMYLAYKRRVNQIREKEALKTEFNKRIAEIEMKALRAQMNPHFLFNSLNSIRLLIDKGDSKSAKHYLTKYSQLLRQVLNNSKNKLIRLENAIEVLKLYLDLEKMRFKNFNYSISINDNVEIDFIDIPPLLMQPYVENAIWHGLMHKNRGERKLDIRIEKEAEFVIIEIEDNGIGRVKSELINASRKKSKESLGLRLSEDRLKYLNDYYGKNASVEIIDLENSTGTRVIIHIPVND